MIKKLKLGLLIAVLSLVAGVGSAYAIDLTFSSNTKVTIGGYDYTILSGSAATTFALATDGLSLAVEVPTSSTFSLVSPNRHTLTTTGGTVTCTNSESTLVITGLTSTTRTITPSTTACGAITGGGGGGGGGSYVAPVTPVLTTPTVIAGCVGTTGFSSLTGQSCAGNTTTTVTTTTTTTTPTSTTVTTTTYNLGTTTLRNGSKGNAVKELQKVLNKLLNLGLVVDGKLGPKTIAVIKTWQKNHGLKADGLVGKLTKAAMKAEAEK